MLPDSALSSSSICSSDPIPLPITAAHSQAQRSDSDWTDWKAKASWSADPHSSHSNSTAPSISGHTGAVSAAQTRRGRMAETLEGLLHQVSALLGQAREQHRAGGETSGQTTQAQLARLLRSLLAQQGDYLDKLMQAYTLLFPDCLVELDLERQIQVTVQHLVLMSETVLNQEYTRLNRSNNQRLRQMILGFTRPVLGSTAVGVIVPQLAEGECILAVFLQRLRQNLGAQVLKSPSFRASYREVLLSSLRNRHSEDAESRWDTVRAWLGEAMRSFDPLQAYGHSGHDRSTFIAWAREVIQNRQNDEARRYLRRETDQFLVLGAEAIRLFNSRWQALPAEVRDGFDRNRCLQFIETVQQRVPSTHWRPTLRLRRRVAELTGWSLEQTVQVHEQVRRVLEQYIQATLPLNDQLPYLAAHGSASDEPLSFITQFLEDTGTPSWVRDWCNQQRTQAEIARLLCVSQPTVSRCLRREYREWLYRSFLRDPHTPSWMQRWYDTRNLPDANRRQERRSIHSDYANGQRSVQVIDQSIEAALRDWCELNDIRYLTP
ncbi:hypothetical protein H6F94_15025 [Leptolyngbya sp. FACHB-261]|nr:hypothetical protein [Leptolyngbya sp. FACHB-261]